MKNEDRILELLVEALQRIDRHSEQFRQQGEQFKQHSKEIADGQNEMKRLQGELINVYQLNLNSLTAIQQNQQRTDRHDEAIGALRERTESIHQTSLEQQKTLQAMMELLMHHNRALSAKGIL